MSLHLPGWLGIQRHGQAPLLSAVPASPPRAAVRASPLKPRKASQPETLPAGTGRPRQAKVGLGAGVGVGWWQLWPRRGSWECHPAWLLGTPTVQGNDFIPDASKARLQLSPAGRHGIQSPSLGSHQAPLFPGL